MGYEVLDSAGRATDLPDDARPPHVDVLDLDPDLDDGALPADEQPALAPQVRRWLTEAGPLLAAASSTARRTLRVVSGSLVVGAVLSGLAIHANDESTARRAQRSVLAVDAAGTDLNVDVGPDTATIATTARVTNHGPAPIRVVTGTSRTGLVVTSIGTAATTVPAGARGTVKATLVVDCGAATLVPMPILQVRTADGRSHDVPLELGAFGSTPLREAVCGGSQGPNVDASLTGSLDRPVLQLTNRTAKDQTVTVNRVLTSDGDGRPLVTVSTVPAGPLVVRANGHRDVRIVLRVARCLRDVTAVNGVGYLPLDVTPTGGGPPLSSGVDAGPLVGVALARACSR